MSRSGYSDDCENLGLWRGAVERAMNGKRGQAFLREMLAALDALPEKRLIADDLQRDGEVCAIGSVGAARQINMSTLDPHDWRGLSKVFGISHAMVQEIEFENDEGNYDPETPEQRYSRIRRWVQSWIKQP